MRSIWGLCPLAGATLEEVASDKHYLMKPSVDRKGLTHRFTRRRKEKLIFDAEDAGKTVYMCCRYENQKGQAGAVGASGFRSYSVNNEQ
jgi:hypothetical protein